MIHIYSEDEIQEEARALVAEYLGKHIESEDHAGLSQDLSITDEDFEAMLELYETDRDKWLDWMETRAATYWKREAIERLEGDFA